MSFSDLWTIVQDAWRHLPFPFLFVYLILAGLVWLFVEYQFSRTGRATPGWRRPVPLLPFVSVPVTWLMRASNWAIWLWVALFIVLTATQVAERFLGASQATDVVGTSVTAWQQGYQALVQLLPNAATTWLPGI